MRDLCAGALIRTRRLERNFSQEGLCRGICAASYLSKIEKGTVAPSEEIVQKLFAALDLTYTTDEAVLAPLRKAMDDCFTLSWEEGDFSALRAQIAASRDLLLCSPLHLQCLLFDALCACQDGDFAGARGVLSRLQSHLSQLDFPSLVRYHLLCGLSATDHARALESFGRAHALAPGAVTAYHQCYIHFQEGRYQEALRFARQAYDRAAQDGSVFILKNAAFLEGVCYSNLYEYPLMRAAFDRTRALSQDDPAMLRSIDYNLGASYVSIGDAAQALPYLRRALDGDADPSSRFFTLHKLALAYQLLSDREEGLCAVAQAQAILDAPGDLPPVYRDMLHLIALRFEENYTRSDEYLALARRLYHSLGQEIHYGFMQFHAPLLLEALCAHRLYKEALHIALDTRFVFPPSLKKRILNAE